MEYNMSSENEGAGAGSTLAGNEPTGVAFSMYPKTHSESSPYADLYKTLTKNKETSQAERREQFLKEIRKRRSNITDENRGLLTETALATYTEDMDVDKVPQNKRRNYFKNKLTFTEWLVDVPTDLEQNWYVKFCPYGHRCLVVGEKYQTSCYNRKGVLIHRFESVLPGGGYSSQRKKVTMLDCLYNKDVKVYFVLDVLYWNSVALHKYDAEFRFYWLKSKVDETPELSQISKHNNFRFQLLEHIPAIPSLIGQHLSEISRINDTNMPCDGLLFYHKESLYISGFTPLVGWLKPHMVMELFGVSVHSLYLEKVPEGYTTLTDYVNHLDRYKRRNDKKKMEVDT